MADAIGRVRTLVISILAYSVFAFLSGLAQSYEQLLVARTLLGLGFGGEWTVGALLMAEVAQPAQRGRMQGAFASAYAVGWGLAAGAYAALFSALPAAVAWRVLLWLGVVPALLTLWIRLRLQDPPVYLAAHARRGRPHPPETLAAIFGPALLRVTAAGFLLSAGALCGKYVIAIWLPTYLEDTLHLAVAAVGLQQAAVIDGAFAGYVLGGYVNDWLGRRGTFLVFAIASGPATALYVALPANLGALLGLVGFGLGFCQAAVVGGLGAYLAELYPTRVRGSGQGFCYSLGRGVSGVLPGGVGLLAATTGLGPALALSAAVYALCLVALRFLPETRGAELTAR